MINKDEIIKKKEFCMKIKGHDVIMDALCENQKIYQVYPGIELSFYQYSSKHITASHEAFANLMQINYCQAGRLEWSLRDGTKIYLGKGDLSVHMLDCCTFSKISLASDDYVGISITIDLDEVDSKLSDILVEVGLSFQDLHQKFFHYGNRIVFSDRPEIKTIFANLQEFPLDVRMPCYKLKIQEILLFLHMMELVDKSDIGWNSSVAAEAIREIHKLLTSDLRKRPTINELAKQYLLNTAVLKKNFKRMYGLPIGTYMKEFRMKKATVRLRQTDESINVIAWQVGYENQSKFSKAFKDVFYILPTEYRRQYRKISRYNFSNT